MLIMTFIFLHTYVDLNYIQLISGNDYETVLEEVLTEKNVDTVARLALNITWEVKTQLYKLFKVICLCS